ncbi:pantothenate kinase [Seiridium cupressi]
MPDEVYQADHAEVATPDSTTAKGAEHDGKATEERIIPRRPRTETNTAEIDSTIVRPGSVRINVKGAFIVDTPEGSPTRNGGSPTTSSAHETKDIRLPNHTAVVSHIAVDIGGSLAKLVYFSREAHSREPGGRLNFMNFETDRIVDCIEFMKHLQDKQLALNGSRSGDLCVMATGGGAYKFYDMIRERLGVDVVREDEMECLIIGLDFFITEIPREVFTYSETDPMHFKEPEENIYPYMLVNIGSGVSMLKVSGPRTYERVGGTHLGGGTLWGLLSLLTPAESFDEMLTMAAQGDNSKVDMLVGDIYGADYGKIGLKSTTIASSFGKVFKMKREAESEAEDSGGLSNGDDHHHRPSQSDTEPSSVAEAVKARFSAADVSRSLLYAVSNNIGQIAYLQSRIHNLSHIYFGGSFIRGHPQTMNTLSYAIKFWSKGEKQAYFLRHEGYLGSVGAFLKRQPLNWGRRGSFEEAAGIEARMKVRADGENMARVDDAVI